MRVATLNVGTMTGKGRELVDLFGKRKIGVLYVQETKWKGNKARELAKKKADLSGHDQDKEDYKQAKKEVSRAVAKVKAEILNKVYKEMETPQGEKKILRIAMARDIASRSLTQIRVIKDSNGIVVAEENEIKRRWETYFEGLLNGENQRTVFEDGLPNEAATIGVTRREVEQAVKKMKNNIAARPDNIPVEVWKSLREEGIDILWYLMQRSSIRKRCQRNEEET
ncbi:uncharacterized protein [Palaemon carinicauda]|uniref:uncharacterized protein n=1 Tax=Palaemon carinicauda TaxID=392227 RepID=UPI0035B583EB